MKKWHYLLLAKTLFVTSAVFGQESKEYEFSNLIGHWYTDSTAQINTSKPISIYSKEREDILVNIKNAIFSREFTFSNTGEFSAKWEIESNITQVQGKWKIIGKDKIFIEVDGIRTNYLISSHSEDRIILIPLRDRRGETHELYFIRKK